MDGAEKMEKAVLMCGNAVYDVFGSAVRPAPKGCRKVCDASYRGGEDSESAGADGTLLQAAGGSHRADTASDKRNESRERILRAGGQMPPAVGNAAAFSGVLHGVVYDKLPD